jgi:hypothetical protein
MRTVIAVVLVAGLALLGVPHFGGMATVSAQQGATVSGSGFAAGSSVQLMDVNNNVVATATADASGNVTFTNVAEGNVTLVGEDAAGNAVATTAAVTAAAVAAGTAIAAGAATAAVAVGAAAGAVAAAGAAAGALGAVGGVVGATAIAGGVAAAGAEIAVATGGNRDICTASFVTDSIPDSEALPMNATEGACVASPE